MEVAVRDDGHLDEYKPVRLDNWPDKRWTPRGLRCREPDWDHPRRGKLYGTMVVIAVVIVGTLLSIGMAALMPASDHVEQPWTQSVIGP
jgi:hypothetical protein